MKYLISTFDCVLFATEKTELKKNTKYKILSADCDVIVFANNTIPFLLDLKNNVSSNLLKVQVGIDFYYFLFPIKFYDCYNVNFKFGSHEVQVSLLSDLKIIVDGELICEQNVDKLKYSHYQVFGDICIIFFEGKRNFVAILKGKELKFCSYYDECNIADDEKYFMCKLNDFLNHGKVCHIKNQEIETYLVYLDEEELNLKEEFLSFVFLDCFLASNLKYCNNLLSDELKLEDEKQLKNFFPKFDYYYPVSSEKFILINKNTLAGIFEFDIKNNKIINIKSL